jgi:hypothetical protein
MASAVTAYLRHTDVPLRKAKQRAVARAPLATRLAQASVGQRKGALA